MCQLTFLRGNPLLVRSMLFNLSASNARSGNNDGFGYYNFAKQEVFRTKESAKDFVYTSEFLDILDRDIPVTGHKKVSILSHVRSASRWGGKLQTVCEENTHPFILNNLVLAHNGTLWPKDDKDELKDSIDSYWFLHKLNFIVGEGKLKHKHIIETMKHFEGKFAFLIVDLLQPNDLWIVRGKTADLHFAWYVDEKDKEVLFMINTKETNIDSPITEYFYRLLLGNSIKLKGSITEFPAERISRYNIISGRLTTFKDAILEEDHTVVSSAWNHRRTYHGTSHSYVRNSFKEIMEDVLNLATKNILTYSEVSLLYETFIGSSIFDPKKEDLLAFIELLEKLTKESEYKGRIKSWIKVTDLLIEQGFDVMDLYSAYPQLKFPWMLNSKKAISRVHTRIIQDADKLKGIITL